MIITRALRWRLAAGLMAASLGLAAIGADTASAATTPTYPPIIASMATTYGPSAAGAATQWFGDGTTAFFLGRATTSWFTLVIKGKTDEYSITVGAPEGQKLRAGRWSDIRSYINEPEKPYISLSAGGDYAGDLQILDIASRADGTLTRLDLNFQGISRDAALSQFGEVRMGEPEDASSVRIGFTHFIFPRTPKGARIVYAKETLHNTSSRPVAIGRAALSGLSRGSYSISNDRCSGTTLGAGAWCSIRVGFQPRGGGPLVATMKLTTGPSTRTIDLSGTALLGTSSLTYGGNDFISSGHNDGSVTTTHTYTEADWDPRAYGPINPVPGGDNNSAYFSAVQLYTAPTRAAYQISMTRGDGSPSDYSLYLEAAGRGCGQGATTTVDARDYAVDSVGFPTIVDLDFTQACDERPDFVMHGTLLFQARDDVTPPAPVTDLAVTAGTHRTVSWTPSSDATRTTIARLVKGDGTNATATSGYALSSGAVSSAALPTLTTNAHYTVAVFTVDTTGNVGAPATTHLVG